MKIQVKQHHIDFGKRVNCRFCPVALAIKEARNMTYGVSAGPDYISIAGRDYKTPLEVGNFMYKFDAYLKVEPFEFELV